VGKWTSMSRESRLMSVAGSIHVTWLQHHRQHPYGVTYCTQHGKFYGASLSRGLHTPQTPQPLYATPQNHSQFCQNAGTFGPQNLPQNRRFTLNKLNTLIFLGLSLYYSIPLAFPSRAGGAMWVSSCYHCGKLVPFWCIYLNLMT
jgi:hypothetical protein